MASIRTIQTAADNGKIAQNNKSYENFSYFLGGVDVTDQNLDQFTPYIQGVSKIFVHKTPPFMSLLQRKASNDGFAEWSRQFKTYLESGYTRIDGIGDISAEFVDFEGGFAAQKFSNVSTVRDETDTLSIQLFELTGSPVREYIETWMTGVRDPRTGIAHYHGVIGQKGDDGVVINYQEKNHTAEFVYLSMDPTAKKIEYACLFAHAFPTKVPKSHLNYESGNRDRVQMDLDFNITKYESYAINNIAIGYMNASAITYNYLDFVPDAGESKREYFTYKYGQTSTIDENGKYGTPVSAEGTPVTWSHN